MSEIMFRVWYKPGEIMLGPEGWMMLSQSGQLYESGPITAPHPVEKEKDFVVMRYTGLKDKNGQDIYEGDILLTDDKYHDYQDGIAINELPDGKYVPVVWSECAFLANDELLSEVNGYYEVVGNIYENKDLLHES